MIRNIMLKIKTSRQSRPAQKPFNVLSFNCRQTCSIGVFFFISKDLLNQKKDYFVIKRGINVHMDKNVHSFNDMHFILN